MDKTQAYPRPWKRFKNSLYWPTGEGDFYGDEYIKICGFKESKDCDFAHKAINCHDKFIVACQWALACMKNDKTSLKEALKTVLKEAGVL